MWVPNADQIHRSNPIKRPGTGLARTTEVVMLVFIVWLRSTFLPEQFSHDKHIRIDIEKTSVREAK